MATKTEVGVKITVDGSQAESSVGNIKKELKLATQELIAARSKFGELSDEAVAAAKKVANLKDEIGDAKSMTEAFNPDAKFKGLGAALQGVAGGFAAIQGAQAIFGTESKELEKTLLKVQGAMALTQGINSVLEAKDSFKVLKKVAIDAFKGIKTAIGSTGIGLLVVALGTLVAYWDDIKEAVSGVSEEQLKLNETTKKNLAAEQEKLKAMDLQDNALRLQGKSEKEILQSKLKQIDLTIQSAKINIQSEEQTQKVKEAAAKRNFDLTKNIIRGSMEFGMIALRVLAAPIDLVIATANKAAEILGFEKIVTENINDQITKLTTTASETLSKFLFDPAETKKEGEKTVKEAKDNLKQLESQRDGYKLQIQKMDKDAAKQQSDQNQKTKEEQIKLEEEFQKRLLDLRQQNALDSIANETDRAKKQALFAFENAEQEIKNSKFSEEKKNQLLSELRIKYNLDIAKIDKDAQAKQADIDKKFNDDRLAAQAKTDELITQARSASFKNEFDKREYDLSLQVQGEIDAQIDLLNKKLINEETYRQNVALIDEKYAGQFAQINQDREKKRVEDEKKSAEDRIKIAQEELNAKVEISNQNADIAVGLANLLKSTNEKSKGVAIASLLIEQAAAISKIITSTQVANLGALATPQAIATSGAAAAPVILRNNIMAGISIATAIASVVKGINQIKSASSSGSGGGGGGTALPASSMGISAPIPPQAQTTTLNQSQVNQIGNAAARAYIVESDVTGSQERIQRLNRAARIA